MGVAFVIFIVIMSIILHEIAHGYVANLCGDPTAEAAGRLTLNPIPHIDPMMTIILPLAMGVMTGWQFVFGGAKPVPISPGFLRKWPRDFILVAIAGVTVNVIIGILLSLLAQVPFLGEHTRQALAVGAFMNYLLAVFNLIPVPPLDGSRVFRFLLPQDMRKGYDRLEPWGFMIIIGLVYTGVTGKIMMPILIRMAEWSNILELLYAWWK